MNDEQQNRPLGVAHLIFGLVFTGIAAIWLIGRANDTDIPDLAAAFPAVLIVAGVVGLVASVTNQRRARARLLAQREADRAAYETQYPVPDPTTEQAAHTTDTTDTTQTTAVLDTPAGTDDPKDES